VYLRVHRVLWCLCVDGSVQCSSLWLAASGCLGVNEREGRECASAPDLVFMSDCAIVMQVWKRVGCSDGWVDKSASPGGRRGRAKRKNNILFLSAESAVLFFCFLTLLFGFEKPCFCFLCHVRGAGARHETA
jgi:hypothetical protein